MARKLNDVIVAISDPTRRAIIGRLAKGPARISDIAARFPMSLTGVCKHVRVLERAGLVRRIHHGRHMLEHQVPLYLEWFGIDAKGVDVVARARSIV